MAQITLKMLKVEGACHDQVALFRQHFGRSVEVTREACLAVALVFDWDWAAIHLLSGSAREAYEVTKVPAWEAYKATIAGAFYAAWILDHPETGE